MAESADLAEAIDENPTQARAVLLTQLRYLIDEVEALKPLVNRVPTAVQEGRPTPDDLSMKEIYGAIALRDAQVHRPRLQRVAAADDETPAFESVDDETLVEKEDWDEWPLPDILDRVQSARRALVEQLDAVPVDAWHRAGRFDGETQSLFEIVHRITREDADRLRNLGYRLHEANLTDRDRDLPK
jgi:hypothetical protein